MGSSSIRTCGAPEGGRLHLRFPKEGLPPDRNSLGLQGFLAAVAIPARVPGNLRRRVPLAGIPEGIVPRIASGCRLLRLPSAGVRSAKTPLLGVLPG